MSVYLSANREAMVAKRAHYADGVGNPDLHDAVDARGRTVSAVGRQGHREAPIIVAQHAQDGDWRWVPDPGGAEMPPPARRSPSGDHASKYTSPTTRRTAA